MKLSGSHRGDLSELDERSVCQKAYGSRVVNRVRHVKNKCIVLWCDADCNGARGAGRVVHNEA